MPAPRPPVDVFAKRPEWAKFGAGARVLATRLETRERAITFVHVCSKMGVPEKLSPSEFPDADSLVDQIALMLTSFGTALARDKKLMEGAEAIELSLAIRPRSPPAWYQMALICALRRDRAAVDWADKVLTFKPDPHSSDSWERALATAISEAGERGAAAALNKPDMVGTWEHMLQTMRDVKKMFE